jgi:antitoxin MazE
MQSQVKKWGNSAAVRIPATVMASAALCLDQIVDISEENGILMIKPLIAPVYELEEMLTRMTSDTFHDDTDFGAPVGGEVW